MMIDNGRDYAKDRIARDLQGDLMDDNHATRRYFRCWLDGSYLGEEHYRANVAFLRENSHKPRALRSFVISEFCQYTAHDADCSTKYAQNVITDIIPHRQLERLNNALIDDALDLIAEYEEDI
ncbi:MAG: hypothetical protein ACO2YK_13955 [Paracoccaceae bacterium]